MPGWVSYLALQASLADRNQLFYRKGYFEYVLPLIRVGVHLNYVFVEKRTLMLSRKRNQSSSEHKSDANTQHVDEIPQPVKQTRTRDVLLLFFATRLMLVAITCVGYILLTAPKYSSTPVDTVTLFNVWNHWDAANYTRIAQYGYQARFDLAFFPLFPFLVFCISSLLGNWSYLFVGTLISNGALLGVLFLLYQLAADIAGEQVARRTIVYLCIFPTAFFFFAAYNESLFLVFILGTFLAIRQQRWWLAGILGFLAALTRSAGILLVLPYLYELWEAQKSIRATKKSVFFAILPIIFIPLGVLVYSVYCWITVGTPLAFITIQDHSGRHLSWPWQGLWQGITALLLTQPFGSANQAHLFLDLSATIGFLLLVVLGWRKLPVSYSLWTGLLLLYVLLDPAMEKPDILLSNQRFVLEMFPAFITLAALGVQHPRLHQTLAIVFPSLLATLSILFIMNRWMV